MIPMNRCIVHFRNTPTQTAFSGSFIVSSVAVLDRDLLVIVSWTDMLYNGAVDEAALVLKAVSTELPILCGAKAVPM